MATKGGDPWGKKGRRCKSKSKQTGAQCRNPAIPGGLVCRFHGGATKASQAAFAANREAAAVEKAIGQLRIDPLGDPLLELKKLAGEVVAWKDAIAQHVAKLTSLRYSTDGGEQVRGEVVLFERAMDRCASVLGLIAKLNIDDRLVAIEEAKVAKIIDALDATLDALDLPVARRLEAKRGMAQKLRAIG